MARSKKTPGQGHNSEPLTDDELAALQVHYGLKIRSARHVAAEAKATYDTARGEVNALFKRAGADLKWTRKEFEDLLEKQDMSDAEFKHAEAKRSKRYELGGLPVGAQLDMFAGDTVDDKAEAHANGYRAGLRADDPTPPSNIATFLHPDWLAGWNAGQEFNAMQLAKAETILEARKPATVALEADDEAKTDEDPADPEVIRRKANELKDSGWTDPAGDEAKFEDAA